MLENYRYWQQHGQDWHDEYDSRKRRLVYYHCQELMLADYLEHSVPARVLEFGCGIGRHLRYLRQVPGLAMHGYDQSETMLAGMRRWADPQWMAEHVRCGEPVGRLPYDDGHFDIVYTAEVLVHIDPRDIPTILSELIRVSKWQVMHYEPSREAALTGLEHGGCWRHDLVREYARLGHDCEVLSQGFSSQAPYRVVLDKSRPVYSPGETFCSLLRQTEAALQPGLDVATQFAQELAKERDHSDLTEARIAAMRTQLAEAQDEVGWLREQEGGRLWRRLGRYFHRASSRGEPTS